MYLKEKKLKLLRVRNAVLTALALFRLLVSGYYIIAEFTYYRDTPEYAWEAVSMKQSMILVPLLILFLMLIGLSRRSMGNARFYSGCFEGDLDGDVSCADLAAVTGLPERRVCRQLRFCRRHYMQNFELNRQADGMHAVLGSKTVLCQCRHCGAQIEKRIFFTGQCPYCRSSDLHAAVLAGAHYVSISHDVKKGARHPDFYAGGSLAAKKGLFVILLAGSGLIVLVSLLSVLSGAAHYWDEDYLKTVLLSPDNHYYSFARIRAHILNSVIFSASFLAVFTPLFFLRLMKLRSVLTAEQCAKYFARVRKPFIPADRLEQACPAASPAKRLRAVRNAIRHGYLQNCTLEMHGGKLTAALAKRIIKDQCPGCGAPITGAADEDCTCSFCGRRIMHVVEKK